ncbi:MAG: hypothetical protein JNJ83_02365 [Verrucomicrobiaceae bacterium]|nr:hypothetical protein [Verrucomicrobiaceae bacterium]
MKNLLLAILLSFVSTAEVAAQVLVYHVTQTGVRTQLKYDSSSDAARQFPLSSVVTKRFYMIVDWVPDEGTTLNQHIVFVDYYRSLNKFGPARKSYEVTSGWRYRYIPLEVNDGVNPLASISSGAVPNTYNTFPSTNYSTLLDPSEPLFEYCVLQELPRGMAIMGTDRKLIRPEFSLPVSISPFVQPPPLLAIGIGRQYSADTEAGENPKIHESEVWSLMGVSTILSQAPFLIAPTRMAGHWQDSYSLLEGLPTSGPPKPTKSWFDRSAGSQAGTLVTSLSTLDGSVDDVLENVEVRLQNLGYSRVQPQQ